MIVGAIVVPMVNGIEFVHSKFALLDDAAHRCPTRDYRRRFVSLQLTI